MAMPVSKCAQARIANSYAWVTSLFLNDQDFDKHLGHGYRLKNSKERDTLTLSDQLISEKEDRFPPLVNTSL